MYSRRGSGLGPFIGGAILGSMLGGSGHSIAFGGGRGAGGRGYYYVICSISLFNPKIAY